MNKILKKTVAMALALLLFVSLIPLVPMKAEAASAVESVAIKLSMPPVDCGDVAAMKVTSSAKGCYLDSWVWKDIYGEKITEKFDNHNATIEITLVASPGYSFTDDMEVTIDGAPASFDNYGTSLVISKTFSPVIWKPSIAKHPTEEEVEVGKIISFVSYGSFINESKWHMIDPEGNTFDAETLPDRVPGVKVEASFDKLNISPAKEELNGYKVTCEFKGPGGEITSRPAKIIVVDKVEEKEEEKVTPEGHEHQFKEEILSDAGYHWYECACGAKRNKDVHRYVWVQFRAADLSNEGIIGAQCSVCGHVLQGETQLSESERKRLIEEAAAPSPSPIPTDGASAVPAETAATDAAATDAAVETAQPDVSPDIPSPAVEPDPTETPGKIENHKPELDIKPGSLSKPSATPEPTATPSPTPSPTLSPSPTPAPEIEEPEEKEGLIEKLFGWLFN